MLGRKYRGIQCYHVAMQSDVNTLKDEEEDCVCTSIAAVHASGMAGETRKTMDEEEQVINSDDFMVGECHERRSTVSLHTV